MFRSLTLAALIALSSFSLTSCRATVSLSPRQVELLGALAVTEAAILQAQRIRNYDAMRQLSADRTAILSELSRLEVNVCTR